jgi:membrane associated rhomboid family serine protease
MLPLADTIPSRTFPLVNWLLISANVFFFLLTLSAGPDAYELMLLMGVVPSDVLANPMEFVTLFTSMFLHGGWAHLFSNMLALYIFGDNIEDRMGSGRYLVFYLLCGLLASGTHIAFNPASHVPSVGASGAISGVLGAYILLFPSSRVITLIPIFFFPLIVQLPALVYLGIWFFSQLFNGTLAIVGGVQEYGGVAWWAHAGGFVAGLLLVMLFVRRPVRRAYIDEYWPW